MRQIRRLAYRTGQVSRRPPPPRWRKPALWGLLALASAGLVAGSLHLARESGLVDRARFALHDQMITATNRMGFEVRDILTLGRERTKAGDIYRILEPYYGQNILSVDITAIQQRLQSLPWVREATVARQLPDRLRAELVEHRPIALWHSASGPALVSDAGDIITVAALSPYRHLPILSGADAPTAAPGLMRLLATRADLAQRVTGAERVDGRRWNVFVDGRIEIRLPERDAESAWTRLARLDAEQGLLRRALAAIDLRLDDRVIVRIADEALEAGRGGQPT